MKNWATFRAVRNWISTVEKSSLPVLSLVCSAALVAGCATGYQPNGLTGGFEEAQVNETSFRVSFRGNGYTSTNRAEELTLLRSAELCLERGYPGFVLLRERSDIKNESIWVSNTTVRRGNIFSTGGDLTFSRPSTSNLVSCISEKPANVFSYDAIVLYKSLTTKYQVPRSGKFVDWQNNLGPVRIQNMQETPQQRPVSLIPKAVEPTQTTEWRNSASAYARSIGCSAEPGKFTLTSQGAERYEFSCREQTVLQMECWAVFGGCRRLSPQ